LYFCSKKHDFFHLSKDFAMLILLGWGIFVCLVYLLLWGDTIYYKCNLPKVCKKVLDAFTEEE
jgi:hypothetical protein